MSNQNQVLEEVQKLILDFTNIKNTLSTTEYSVSIILARQLKLMLDNENSHRMIINFLEFRLTKKDYEKSTFMQKLIELYAKSLEVPTVNVINNYAVAYDIPLSIVFENIKLKLEEKDLIPKENTIFDRYNNYFTL